MAQINSTNQKYFIFGFPLSDRAWHRYAVRNVLPDDLNKDLIDPSYEIRKLSDQINQNPEDSQGRQIYAEVLLALRTVNQALRWVAREYFINDNPGSLSRGRQWASGKLGSETINRLYQVFVELFPPLAVQLARRTARDFLDDNSSDINGPDNATIEMILLFLTTINPAAVSATPLFDDRDLRKKASFVPFVTELESYLDDSEPAGAAGDSLFHLLRSPMLASPDSLSGQINYIRENWGHFLPDSLMQRLLVALDVLKEIDVKRTGDPGPAPVLEFGAGTSAWDADQHEPEAFSMDADWMSNVVLMAKSVHVWLDQLSRWHGRPIRTLAEIPDEALDQLARWGVTGLWLIGLWERSNASRLIKQYMGNPEAAASAYALRNYSIASELGGEEAWANLSARAAQRGIRLASDMVPNHMGIDSDWVVNHPDWFLQSEIPPFPAYNFTGGNLSDTPGVAIRIEDGYWDHRDASVVFQRLDEQSCHARYIYHGNDGTSMPWNDTAQLNFLLPQVREAVIQVILDVARKFPIIRFDAAMTLAKKHYQRLWFPAPGDAGAIPSRAEHSKSRADFNEVFPQEFWREVVDRVATEAPDTLLLAEAFWLMEGYFVRTLGMHRVYNSAFMNMLKMEENSKYRQTIKNVLEFSPEVLKRFVNFMNNPDEKTAVEQFGRGDKYFGCAVLLVTMPGLPMLGHGQIEGFSEKYGMEYQKAYWDEQIDQDMVSRHEQNIFPLMRRRHLFSGSENFALFDFITADGWVDENVFAYTNRHGDERAIIFYNNSYESTAGQISNSTAINVGSTEHTHLQHRSLGEALDLNPEQNGWYIFEDLADRHQYIRSADELTTRGFHTNLNGYQYRALTGFQLVSDNDGLWMRLATQLAGGGVPNIRQARRRLEIEPVLTELSTLLTPSSLASLEPEQKPIPVAKTKIKEPTEKISESPKSEKATPTLAQTLADKLKKLPADIADIMPGSMIPQAIYLAQVLSQYPGPWADKNEATISDCLVTTEDITLLLQDMSTAMHEWTGSDTTATRTVLLTQLLVDSETYREGLKSGKLVWLQELFENETAAAFLNFNNHADVTYLNQESLETLLWGFVVMDIVEGLGGADEGDVGIVDGVELTLKTAKTAGYALKAIC